MGIETALLATAVAGTGASLYGQNAARKDAKKQNEKSRKDSILSEIMSIVSGQGPQGINPQYQTPPTVDYGGAMNQLAMMGYGVQQDSIANKRADDALKQSQARTDAYVASEGANAALAQGRAYEMVYGPINPKSSVANTTGAPTMTIDKLLQIPQDQLSPDQIDFLLKYRKGQKEGYLEQPPVLSLAPGATSWANNYGIPAGPANVNSSQNP